MSHRKNQTAGDRPKAPKPPRKITPNPPRPSKPLLIVAILLLTGWLAVLAMLTVAG